MARRAFCQPPVGPFRWRAPRPSQPWASQFMANKFGSRCPQRDVSAGQQLRSTGSENCLFLNIWSPPASTDRERKHRRPVMVWIHSGANVSSAGSDFEAAGLRSGRRGGRHDQLSARGVRLVHAPGAAATRCFAAGCFGQFRHAGSDRGVAMDSPAHCRFRRGSPERDGFWRIGRGLEHLCTARVAAVEGLFHQAIIQSGNMPFYSTAQASNAREAIDPGVIKSRLSCYFSY